MFEKALKLAKSEMELTHIFSLKDAAQAQVTIVSMCQTTLLITSYPADERDKQDGPFVTVVNVEHAKLLNFGRCRV